MGTSLTIIFPCRKIEINYRNFEIREGILEGGMILTEMIRYEAALPTIKLIKVVFDAERKGILKKISRIKKKMVRNPPSWCLRIA